MLLELLNNNVLQSTCFHGTAVLIQTGFFLYIFLLVQTVDVGLLCLKLKVINMDYKNIIFAFIKHDNILLLAHKMETSSLNWTCVYFNKRLILTCIFILLEVLYRFLCPAL